jgi:hypothetical protein
MGNSEKLVQTFFTLEPVQNVTENEGRNAFVGLLEPGHYIAVPVRKHEKHRRRASGPPTIAPMCSATKTIS